MNRYSKGARGERELINKFYENGFSVIRSAGSGVNSISPDIVAIKKGRGYAFECKAWDRTTISIDEEKFNELKKWEENTNFQTFIGWRMNGMGWYFVRLDDLEKGKNYNITKKKAIAINIRLENILGKPMQ
jgi:Holliday junction resolvase